jgi:hypothetical protein
MKTSSKRQHTSQTEIDKRDLVNLDLYNNEIKVLTDRLETIQRDTSSRNEHVQASELRHELHQQRQLLNEFRKKYDMEELQEKLLTSRKHEKPGSGSLDIDNFFLHLKAFEENFAITREKVKRFFVTQ